MTISTIGQTNKFDTLTNNILLRINTHETNHATKNFLLKYVPFLVEKPSKNNFWSAYPPIENSMPTYTVGHSILFPKHPFVDFGTNACRLDFLTNEKTIKSLDIKHTSLHFSSPINKKR